MAAVGAGLRAYTRFARVEFANGETMPAERYLREVEGVVLDVMLDRIFGLRGAAVGSVDALTRFYVLWRFTYRESPIEAGEAYVFCQPQGVEIDGVGGICGPPPALVEKVRGTGGGKFRVRTFEERGGDDALGLGGAGRPAPLVDVVHRLLWLLDRQPAALRRFLDAARPNPEQLRLVTQALCAPVLGGPRTQDAAPTAELRAFGRLNAALSGVLPAGGAPVGPVARVARPRRRADPGRRRAPRLLQGSGPARGLPGLPGARLRRRQRAHAADRRPARPRDDGRSGPAGRFPPRHDDAPLFLRRTAPRRRRRRPASARHRRSGPAGRRHRTRSGRHDRAGVPQGAPGTMPVPPLRRRALLLQERTPTSPCSSSRRPTPSPATTPACAPASAS